MNTIFYNGNIYIGDQENPRATAMMVEGNRITAVGGDEILSLKAEDVQLIDLMGACVTPGLMDTHMHTAHMSRNLSEAQLAGLTSAEALVERVRRFIEENQIPEGEWVRGEGWNQDLFAEPVLPDRHLLDQISTKHPILLTRVCGHCVAANTMALSVMSVTADTPCPPGGSFSLGADGQPDGLFYEDGIGLIRPARKPLTQAEVEKLLTMGLHTAASLGLTTLGSDDLLSLNCPWETVMAAYKALQGRDEMPVRVMQECRLPALRLLEEFFDLGYGAGWGNDIFRVGPIKLFADGSLGARSAYLRAPYADAPETAGIAVCTQGEMDELVWKAHSHDMPVAVHAIGDGAVEMVLDAVRSAQLREAKPHLRHGIVHCQITDRALLERIAAEGLQVYAQPVFLEYDLHIAEARVGHELASTSYAFKTLYVMGVNVSGGSDCPVESLNPLCGIYCAVTRKDYNGLPEGGFFPEECFDRQQALEVFTRGGACAFGMEDRLGMLKPGMLADFAVFDRDIMACEADELLDTHAIMTVVDGKVRYQR